MKKGMKRVLIVAILGALVYGAGRIAAHLSIDTVTIATGLFFGVLAGIPISMLVLTAGRRRDDGDDPVDQVADTSPAQSFRAPVVIVEGRPPRQIAQGPDLDILPDRVTYVSPSDQ